MEKRGKTAELPEIWENLPKKETGKAKRLWVLGKGIKQDAEIAGSLRAGNARRNVLCEKIANAILLSNGNNKRYCHDVCTSRYNRKQFYRLYKRPDTLGIRELPITIEHDSIADNRIADNADRLTLLKLFARYRTSADNALLIKYMRGDNIYKDYRNYKAVNRKCVKLGVGVVDYMEYMARADYGRVM